MKFAVLVIAAAGIGGVAAVAVPSTVLDSGASEVQAFGTRISEFKLRDLNPLRAIYDWEMQEIAKQRTPEELGFHTQSTAEFRHIDPDQLMGPVDVTGSSRRMEDLSARNRANWRSPPPQ